MEHLAHGNIIHIACKVIQVGSIVRNKRYNPTWSTNECYQWNGDRKVTVRKLSASEEQKTRKQAGSCNHISLIHLPAFECNQQDVPIWIDGMSRTIDRNPQVPQNGFI